MKSPYLVVAIVMTALIPAAAAEPWTQWGGPDRDFRAPARLADAWPEADPRTLWDRKLGNGHAAVLVDGKRLYALHGAGRESHVVALDLVAGRTVWERSYDVGYASHRVDWDGPHATPLLVENRLFVVSIDAQVHALDARTGEVLWRRDLVAEEGVDLPQSGFAASPVAFGDRILLPGLGGSGPGVLTLRQEDGGTAWARHTFRSSHASPILISVDDRPHAVFHGMNRILGLDPRTGERLWESVLRQGAADNVSFTPPWDRQRRLQVVCHAYDRAGARGLRLLSVDGSWKIEEAWTNRRLKVEHGNGVLLDGVLYASDGSDPAYVVAIDLDTGAERFKQRGFPKATFLAAGDKLLILDEEGTLPLARPGTDGLEILARSPVLEYNSWTVPTMVGRRLYLRDRFRIKALELP